MRKYTFVILILILGMFLLSACNSGHQPAASPLGESDKISVVATIFPLYDFARAVAGDQAELTMLLKPGAESHSYDPAPADMIKIQNADIFLCIGGESDAWVDRILASLDMGDVQVLRLLDSVNAVEEEIVDGMAGDAADAGDKPAYDEHIWTAPANAVLMVEAIAAALAVADPAHAGDYRANAEVYGGAIRAVDEEIKGVVADAPRRLLVFGDRFPFRYLADSYGLEYRAAFPGCSSESEVSAGTLAYLIDKVSDKQLPYVYHIELSNKNIARIISEQTGAGVLLLHSCQSISRDDFFAGYTYVDLMRQNAENLRKGLN